MKKRKIIFGIGILFSLITLFACESNCVKGSGNIVTKTLEFDEIRSVVAYGSMEVVLRQGDEQLVTATGHSNIIDVLSKKVVDDTWHIDFKADCVSNLNLTIEITLPEFNEATMVGSGKINIQDFNDMKSVVLNVSGSGRIDINQINCDVLNAKVDGSGKINVKGEAASAVLCNLEIEGSGEIDAYQLITEECDSKVIGSGVVNVWVNKQLDAHIVGSGLINYKGNPMVNEHVDGSGSVNDKN